LNMAKATGTMKRSITLLWANIISGNSWIIGHKILHKFKVTKSASIPQSLFLHLWAEIKEEQGKKEKKETKKKRKRKEKENGRFELHRAIHSPLRATALPGGKDLKKEGKKERRKEK